MTSKYPKYATKYTRDMIDGKANPERDMTNRKAQERPARIAAAKAREKAQKEAAKLQ